MKNLKLIKLPKNFEKDLIFKFNFLYHSIEKYNDVYIIRNRWEKPVRTITKEKVFNSPDIHFSNSVFKIIYSLVRWYIQLNFRSTLSFLRGKVYNRKAKIVLNSVSKVTSNINRNIFSWN